MNTEVYIQAESLLGCNFTVGTSHDMIYKTIEFCKHVDRDALIKEVESIKHKLLIAVERKDCIKRNEKDFADNVMFYYAARFVLTGERIIFADKQKDTIEICSFCNNSGPSMIECKCKKVRYCNDTCTRYDKPNHTC